MNYPEIKDEVLLLKIFKQKTGFTNAQLAADMSAFGWEWSEGFLIEAFAGKQSPTATQREFIRLYLLDRYSAGLLVV